MNSTESIPQVWDDERDSQFFRITASLFTPTYCYGASVLLASYDPEDAFTAAADTPAQTAPTQSATPTAETATDLRSHTAH
jgi:hypothetical protein